MPIARPPAPAANPQSLFLVKHTFTRDSQFHLKLKCSTIRACRRRRPHSNCRGLHNNVSLQPRASLRRRDCFSAERVQPFKQVFRELYVPTAQEKTTPRSAAATPAGRSIRPARRRGRVGAAGRVRGHGGVGRGGVGKYATIAYGGGGRVGGGIALKRIQDAVAVLGGTLRVLRVPVAQQRIEGVLRRATGRARAFARSVVIGHGT